MDKKKENIFWFGEDYKSLRMVMIGLAVLSIGLTIALVGFMLFQK